jgi:hypothetical protein
MWEGGSVAFWFEIFKPKKHIAIDLQPRTDSPYFKSMSAIEGYRMSLRHIGIQPSRYGELNEI